MMMDDVVDDDDNDDDDDEDDDDDDDDDDDANYNTYDLVLLFSCSFHHLWSFIKWVMNRGPWSCSCSGSDSCS